MDEQSFMVIVDPASPTTMTIEVTSPLVVQWGTTAWLREECAAMSGTSGHRCSASVKRLGVRRHRLTVHLSSGGLIPPVLLTLSMRLLRHRFTIQSIVTHGALD